MINVSAGQRVQFVTTDNGFGGSGGMDHEEGVVERVTPKTVVVRVTESRRYRPTGLATIRISEANARALRPLDGPRAGTLFQYGGGGYRVDGWLRRREPKPIQESDPAVRELLERLAEKFPPEGYGPDRVPLEFCRREDAQYVCGSGVAGCIARITDIGITGMVGWGEATLADHERHALMLVGEPVR